MRLEVGIYGLILVNMCYVIDYVFHVYLDLCLDISSSSVARTGPERNVTAFLLIQSKTVLIDVIELD